MTGLLMAGSGIRIFRWELDLFILIDGMRDCCVPKLVLDFLKIQFKALKR